MPSRVKTHRLASRHARLPVVGLLGIAAFGAHAQSEGAAAGASKRALSVETGLSISQTLTDNVHLSSTDKQSELITQVSPTLSVRSNAGRVQGFFNYALTGILYARGSGSNALQQTLSAAGKAEAIENFAFVDATASISRQNISALGTQSPDPSLRSDNQTQVSSFSLSPYVRGRLAGVANYEARLNYASTRSGGSSVGNSSTSGGSVRLGSDNSLSLLNWSVSMSRQLVNFTAGRDSESDQATATLTFSVTPELRFSARGGREINNYVSVERQGTNTYGAGVQWMPSKRTTLTADEDQRFFGRSHSIRFEHRTPRTVWAFVDARDVTSGAAAAASGPLLTEFDLLFLQLTSQYPDPIERARQTLIQLQLLGKNPFAIAPGGFLTAAVSAQRRQELSFGYLGLRTTVLLSAFQTQTSRLDPLSTAVDSLSGGASVRQRGVSLGGGYRLTPRSALNLNTTRTRTTDSTTGARSDLVSITAGWTSQVGARANVSLSARRTVSEGATSSYNESALLGTLTLRF